MKLLFKLIACLLPLNLAAADPDAALLDWTRQPFSDRASHGVLWRKGEGLMAWQLSSASAFGSQSAATHSAKVLLQLRLEVEVESEAKPRLAQGAAQLQSYPFWVEERLDDGPLSAEVVTLYPVPDLAVAVANIKNTGAKALKLRPRLRMSRPAQALKGQAELSSRYPAWWLDLDRGLQVGRSLVDYVGVWMGGQPWEGKLKGATVKAREAQSLQGADGLDLDLGWPQAKLLGPGQVLRVPVLLGWGPDRDELQKRSVSAWNAAALPAGTAWTVAKQRWAQLKQRLPAVDAGQQQAYRRAVLDLLLSDYAPRAALGAAQFSAQKGSRDAFFSLDSPLAALGWAELDKDKAEAAVLDLASFSAALPAPVPPYTGEDKLQWEAAGLPLHAWVGWQLYHRDPQPQRAGRFLAKLGKALRSEAAWWPQARDGDGNGLYAFARHEEEPPYLRRRRSASEAGEPLMTTWSLGLTSLLAWQYQAAAALAGADQAAEEAQDLLGLAQKSQAALSNQAWDGTQYAQGFEGFWPLLLGLESDEAKVKAELESYLLPGLKSQPPVWMEHGLWEPWRVYFLAKTLASYGKFEEAQALCQKIIALVDNSGINAPIYGNELVKTEGSSAATAAVMTQMILDRQEEEIFLTSWLGPFEARMLQLRSLDGTFYLKRTKISDKIGKFSKIRVETPKNGSILSENSFIISADESITIQIQSDKAMDIHLLGAQKALIFKGAHKVEKILRAKQRLQIDFVAETKKK